jgi:ppGpp synthetase/RelA/SpoT-type nucleotidyltranferase
VLLVLSWILLYSLIGNSQDSICYSRLQLQKIANKVVRANECDTLLIITEKKNQSLLEKLDNKDIEIINLNKENNLRDIIIVGKTKDFETEQAENKKLIRKLKLTKLGWCLTGILIFFL